MSRSTSLGRPRALLSISFDSEGVATTLSVLGEPHGLGFCCQSVCIAGFFFAFTFLVLDFMNMSGVFLGGDVIQGVVKLGSMAEQT